MKTYKSIFLPLVMLGLLVLCASCRQESDYTDSKKLIAALSEPEIERLRVRIAQLYDQRFFKLSKQNRDQIRNAKTIAVQVKQSYFNAAAVSLPLFEDVSGVFRATGFECIEDSNQQIQLNVSASGSPLGANYGINIGIYHAYTGATLTTHLSLQIAGHTAYAADSKHTIQPSRSILVDPKSPKRGSKSPPVYQFFEAYGESEYYPALVHLGFEMTTARGALEGIRALVMMARLQPDSTAVFTQSFRRAWQKDKMLLRIWEKLGAAAVPPLLFALRDTHANVRRIAAQALGSIGDTLAVMRLIVALHDSDNQVRDEAATALGNIGDARAIKPLLTCLTDSLALRHQRSTHLVGEALCKIPDPRVAEHLIPLLQGPNMRLRTLAAELLGELRDPRAVEPLIAALSVTEDQSNLEHGMNLSGNLRESAARALGRFSDTKAVPSLIEALNDNNYNVRGAALEALEKIRGEKLYFDYDKWQDWWRRDGTALTSGWQHARELGTTKSSEDFDRLLMDLQSKDSFIRRRTVFVLGMSANPEAVPAIITALQDPAWSVRLEAVAALRREKNLRAIEPLIAAMDDQERYVEDEAFRALTFLTGKNLTTASAKWRDWWQENKASYLKEQ